MSGARIAGSVDERIVLGIGSLAGVIAASAGAQPTVVPVADVVIVLLGVVVVVWAGASAPWWALAGAAGLGAVTADTAVVTVIGALGFGLGLVIGIRPRHRLELRAVVAAIALNCLVRSDLGGFHGSSALLGLTIAVVVLVTGLLGFEPSGRSLRERRIGLLAMASVGAAAMLATVLVGIVGLTVGGDLRTGAQQARSAIDTLNSGDYRGAADQFEASSLAFGRADGGLGGALALPSRLVPVLSQNVRAGAELSTAAADALGSAAIALRSVDADSLRVMGGAIDIEAIRAVEAPLVDVRGVLADLDVASTAVASPWLLGPVREQLDELEDRLAKNEPRLEDAIEAVRLAPQMLGAPEGRRYLVMFNSPAEARGLSGFIGNFAVVTMDNGRIRVDEFGRRSELELGSQQGNASCAACPAEMLDRYASFGLDVGAGFLGDRGWTAMTMPAHFPYVGEASQIIFPQSGGQPIDGVVAMDPHVVQALMQYTGPIELAEAEVTVQPDDAARFLLEDQYLLIDAAGNEERIDAIDTLGQQVIEQLLSGALPSPNDLARDLGPLVAEHRLLVWTDRPEEQDLLDRVGLLGGLPPLGDDGGFSVMVTNKGRSKIDAFLDRTVDVEVVTADDGARTLVADVSLTNTAPPAGLPAYVIGNSFGLPDGSSYLWVNFFGPETAPTVTRNGRPIEIDEPEPEAGWWASAFDDVLGPGETVTYRVVYPLGPAVDDVDAPVRWDQPLARRDP